MAKQQVLVTGVAGFIASHTTAALLSRGYAVVGVDNMDPYYSLDQKRDNLAPLLKHPDFIFMESDLSEAECYKELSKHKCGAVIHLAAKAGVRPSMEDPIAYYKANVTALVNLLEFARIHGIKNFVFASSSSVYGENTSTPFQESDLTIKPISPYASTKLSGEGIGYVYSEQFDVSFTALRFFTVYGPGQRPDLAIHKFLHKIENEETITLYGDGTTIRDYTYIADIVQGVVNALEKQNWKYEIINIGRGQPIILSEMVKTISEVCGKEAKVVNGSPMAGDVSRTLADISKAKKLIGYDPQISFKEGIENFYDWYKSK